MKTLFITIAILLSFTPTAFAENICGNEDPRETATSQERMDELCDEEGSAALWEHLQAAHRGVTCPEVIVCTSGDMGDRVMVSLHIFYEDCTWDSTNTCSVIDTD